MLVEFLNQVREAKIKFFGSLKQESDEDRSEWEKLAQSLKVRTLCRPFFSLGVLYVKS